MQLRSWIAGTALALWMSPALAVDSHQARLAFEYFADSDHVHVYATGGQYGLDLTPDSRLSISWNRELVVVPGISAPAGSEEALDAISGASRPIASTSDPYADFTKTRNQMDATARWRWISAGYYVSDETDYFAQQVHGAIERPLFANNTIVRGAASYGWDDIQPLADDDNPTVANEKTALHASIVVTQVLTPVTIVQAGAEMTQVDGLQHNPYRTVYVDGGYVPELHPLARMRQDAFIKVNQYFSNRSSVKLDYKIYQDDWGITSHTIGGKLSQYVGKDVVVRYRYRYYTQSAAEFWAEEYLAPGGVDGSRTVDFRMQDFDAHLFGTKLTWDLSGTALAARWFRGTALNLKYERYFNTTNFSANIFETGLSLAF